jgi:hypothetical protein
LISAFVYMHRFDFLDLMYSVDGKSQSEILKDSIFAFELASVWGLIGLTFLLLLTYTFFSLIAYSINSLAVHYVKPRLVKLWDERSFIDKQKYDSEVLQKHKYQDDYTKSRSELDRKEGALTQVLDSNRGLKKEVEALNIALKDSGDTTKELQKKLEEQKISFIEQQKKLVGESKDIQELKRWQVRVVNAENESVKLQKLLKSASIDENIDELVRKAVNEMSSTIHYLKEGLSIKDHWDGKIPHSSFSMWGEDLQNELFATQLLKRDGQDFIALRQLKKRILIEINKW